MTEKWIDLNWYGGAYRVSNFGRVYSRHKKGDLAIKTSRNGYAFVTLYSGNKLKNYLVHRLVATYFIPNPESKPEVNHIDHVRCNNQMKNLEWATRLENVSHGDGIEKMAETKRVSVDQLSLTGKLIKTWRGMRTAEQAGFNHGRIWLCCHGDAATHGGFKWRYRK